MLVEQRVAEPLFRISLFKIRAFTYGNIASLALAMSRGGMQFMLIIWLQGIWLPLHGYSYSQTPLWAGIYLVPLTVGFLASAPLSGFLSDRFGAKAFTVGGSLLAAVTFLALAFLPVNFSYWEFALIVALNGFGSGLFVSPNRAEMMNSVPADARGAAGGMIATFMNSAVRAVHRHLLLADGDRAGQFAAAHPVRGPDRPGGADRVGDDVSHLPPIGVLFAAFLGYNPMQQLLGPVLGHLQPGARRLCGRAGILPERDHRSVPQRPRHRVRVRDRGLCRRGHRLGADRADRPAGQPRAGRRRAGRGRGRGRVRAERARDLGDVVEDTPQTADKPGISS